MLTLPLERRLIIFHHTVQTIHHAFAHRADAGALDSAALFETFLPRVLASETRHDFMLVMTEMMARLNNGHSYYYDQLLHHERRAAFGARHLDDLWLITTSQLPQITPGDVLLALDGVDTETCYQQTRQYLCATNDRQRRIDFVSTWFRLIAPPKFRVTLRNHADETVTVAIDRSNLPERAPLETTGRWLNATTAYIAIPAFNEVRFEDAALEQLERYRSADALIIDLRGNGGGTTPLRLIQQLMNQPYRFYAESTPLTLALIEYYKTRLPQLHTFGLSPEDIASIEGVTELFHDAHLLWQPKWQQPHDKAYGGKLILLSDAHVASAAEDMLMPFKDNGRAIIVGERSKGSTGQTHARSYEEGIVVLIGIKRTYYPDGTPFEGRGITPDVVVLPTREQLYRQTDTVLEQALALCQS